MRAKRCVKHMVGQINMLSNKRQHPRRTNVGLDQMSIVPFDWIMDDIYAIKQNS